MNTKGMKFLAVLTVLAMAFAAFAVVAPAETDDATDATYNSTAGTIVVDGTLLQKYTTSTTVEKGKYYYFDSDATVALPAEASSDKPIVTFIKEGVTVTFTVSDTVLIGDYDVLAFAYSSYDDTDKKITLTTAANALLGDSTPSDAYSALLESGTKLKSPAALSWDTTKEYSQKSVAVNPGDASSAFSLKAADGTVGFVAAKILDIWTATSITGTVESLNYCADVAVTYKDFTGTVKIGTTIAVKLSAFSGSIAASNTVSKLNLSTWTAGNIEVAKGTLTQNAAITIGALSALTIGAGSDDASYDATGQTVTNNGVIIVGAGHGTLTGGDSFTNNGKLTVAGTITATGLVNDGTLTIKSETATFAGLTLAAGSTGKIVNQTSAESKISGTLSSSPTVFAANQKVTVEDDLVIDKPLTVYGLLYIPSGSTVTITGNGVVTLSGIAAAIQNEGTIIIDNNKSGGTLIVSGSTLDNYGSIEVRNATVDNQTLYVGNASSAYSVFNNYGEFTDESGVILFAEKAQFNNKNTGVAQIMDTMEVDELTTITNAGSIYVSGGIKVNEKTSSTEHEFAVIQMVANGAIFTASNMAIVDGTASDPTLKISNMMTKPEGSTGYNDTSASTVTFANSDTDKFQGLTIKSGWFKVGTTTYKSMDLSGTVNAISTNGSTVAGKDIAVAGVITVLDELSIPGQADLNLNGATFVVKGTVAVVQSAGHIESAGTDTVTVLSGSIVSPQIVLTAGTDTLNAAYFSKNNNLGPLYYYMPLKNAIAEAVEMEAKNVYIGNNMATMSIDSDIEIPAGIAVTNYAASNGAANPTGLTVNKDCTLTVKDGASLTNSGIITVKGTVYAEVAKTGIKGVEPVADVKQKGEVDVRYTNLANALSNSNVGDVITITAEAVTIADDITIPEGRTVDTNDKNFTINANKTLTVDGTLFINGGVYTNNGDVIVNGYLVTDKVVSYADGWPAGAYYKFTLNNLDYNGICGIDKMDDVIDAEVAYAFTVYGKAKAPAIEVSATSANKATVEFTNDVEISTIAIEFATVKFAIGTDVKAVVTDGISSASMNVTVGTTALEIADSADAFTIGGITTTSADVPEDKYSFVMDGLVTLKDAAIPDATIEGIVSTAKTVTLNDAKVKGALIADYSGKISATNMTVTGGLTTMDVDTSKTAGKVTITGQLIVGEIKKYSGDAAEVSGNVALGPAACAIVVSGSTIDEEIVDGLKVTTITVDKKPWLTIYGNGTANLSKFVIPVTNGQATYFGTTALVGNYLPDPTYVTIGDKATIDITVNYSIYNVTIITDSGIKSVSIDNIEMVRDGNSNIFKAFTNNLGVKLEAGTHTVTYTLYNGYEGTVSLYTMDNTILKDLKFTCSGTDELNYSFQLYGTEQIIAPEPTPVEQNEWTITTILLVILVILIAVMAVIVALRLNRS